MLLLIWKGINHFGDGIEMSSDIGMIFKEPIKQKDWLDFCNENNMTYSKNGYYYYGGGVVQVLWGSGVANIIDTKKASEVTIGTFYNGDLEMVFNLYQKIKKRFKLGTSSPAPEYSYLFHSSHDEKVDDKDYEKLWKDLKEYFRLTTVGQDLQIELFMEDMEEQGTVSKFKRPDGYIEFPR